MTTAAPALTSVGSTTRRRRSVVALLALLALALAAAACMPAEERTFFDRTNALRATEHVSQLAEQDILTAKAEAWAQHMAATGRLEHSVLTADLGDLAWTKLGENVGMSGPTSDTLLTIHNMFVASAEHRANLVNSQYTHMGVGVATDSAGRVWVSEVFAQL